MSDEESTVVPSTSSEQTDNKLVTSATEDPDMTRRIELLEFAEIGRYSFRKRIHRATYRLSIEQKLDYMEKKLSKYKIRVEDIKDEIRAAKYIINHPTPRLF